MTTLAQWAEANGYDVKRRRYRRKGTTDVEQVRSHGGRRATPTVRAKPTLNYGLADDGG